MGLGCGVARRGLEADLASLEDEVLLARLLRVRVRVRARVGVGVRGRVEAGVRGRVRVRVRVS